MPMVPRDVAISFPSGDQVGLRNDLLRFVSLLQGGSAGTDVALPLPELTLLNLCCRQNARIDIPTSNRLARESLRNGCDDTEANVAREGATVAKDLSEDFFDCFKMIRRHQLISFSNHLWCATLVNQGRERCFVIESEMRARPSAGLWRRAGRCVVVAARVDAIQVASIRMIHLTSSMMPASCFTCDSPLKLLPNHSLYGVGCDGMLRNFNTFRSTFSSRSSV
jgi:hypothetical protein